MPWLFAYGSLLPQDRTELPGGVVPCTLRGWRRGWTVAMDNTVDLPGYKHYVAPDGSRPAVMVAFLDIHPGPGGQVNGIAVPVERDELPDLDRRERNYARQRVTGALEPDPGDEAWAYVGLGEARERARRGAGARQLVVAGEYLERVLAGFERLGERDRFERTTAPHPVVADLRAVHASGAPAAPRAVR